MKSLIVGLLSGTLLLFPLRAADFPRIEGWTIHSEVWQYRPGNLWEYINGAADQFIDFGFEELLTTELISNETLIVVDIYNMGKPLNALGIYLMERPADALYIDAGTQSILNLPAQALLLKNQFYVKVHCLEGALTETTGQALLRSLDQALPGSAAWPEEVGLLPQKDRLPGTLGYIRRNFLSISDLNNCLFAEYQEKEGQPFRYFVMLPEGTQTVDSIWERIAAKWQETNLSGQPVIYRQVPYRGLLGLIKHDGRIIGVADVPDQNTMLERLKQFIR